MLLTVERRGGHIMLVLWYIHFDGDHDKDDISG